MWNDPIPVSSNSIQIQLTFAQRFLSLSDQTIESALRNFYGVLLSFYARSKYDSQAYVYFKVKNLVKLADENLQPYVSFSTNISMAAVRSRVADFYRFFLKKQSDRSL